VQIERDEQRYDGRQAVGKYQASEIVCGMFETQNFGDALGKAEPRLNPRRKNRALIQANCEAIYAARDRGCTWADIAKALSEAGFSVSPNALRLAMNEKSRDLKKYPRKMLAERKPRQQVQQSSIKGREEDPLEKKNSNANVGIAMNTPMEKIAAESSATPLPERPPKTATASRFHKMPERL
jgi:hypothetical protein